MARVVIYEQLVPPRDYTLDMAAGPKWGPIDLWDDGRAETLYRRGPHFVLLRSRDGEDQAHFVEAHFVAAEYAVAWLDMHGFELPSDAETAGYLAWRAERLSSLEMQSRFPALERMTDEALAELRTRIAGAPLEELEWEANALAWQAWERAAQVFGSEVAPGQRVVDMRLGPEPSDTELSKPSADEATTAQTAGVELALESTPAAEAQSRPPWTKEAAQSVVRDHLAKHPHATLAEIVSATGVSRGTVGKTRAWRTAMATRDRRMKKRRGERPAQSFSEGVERLLGRSVDPEVDALIERCEADPELRDLIESQAADQAADEAKRRRGRRPTV